MAASLVAELPPGVLEACILPQVPLKDRLTVLRVVNRHMLALVDAHCQSLCEHHGWRLPRRPRGRVAAATESSSWRALYLRHACAICLEVGDFCARSTSNSAPTFMLCGPCARGAALRAALIGGVHAYGHAPCR